MTQRYQAKSVYNRSESEQNHGNHGEYMAMALAMAFEAGFPAKSLKSFDREICLFYYTPNDTNT